MEAHCGHDGRDVPIASGSKKGIAWVPAAVVCAVLAAVLIFWMRWLFLVVWSWFFR